MNRHVRNWKKLENLKYLISQSTMHNYLSYIIKWLEFSHLSKVESIWNVLAHGNAREGKWRGNWWMEWVASALHTTSEHDVSSITTADAHTSAARNRLTWHHHRFKWTRLFRQKTNYAFCACAVTFQTQSTLTQFALVSLQFHNFARSVWFWRFRVGNNGNMRCGFVPVNCR
jgi:hypothetical protein